MIDCVVGARPNFVKLSPLIRELGSNGFDYRLIHTGQHYDREMNEVFFEDLALPEPDIYLGVGSGTHAVQTGQAMIALEEQFMKKRPSLLLAIGDVNSTLAAALAAVKCHIPVGHIEAGYRSGDFSMPEEINRLVVDNISQILFAPTPDAVENLIREGIDRKRVFFVGNLMAEALLRHLSQIESRKVWSDFGLKRGEYAVVTVHRAENTESKKRLTEIFEAFLEIPPPVVAPLHPRTQKCLQDYGIWSKVKDGLILTSPLGYLDFLSLLSGARLVLTDSGGVQEEALMLGVSCLTLRSNTERILTVRAGGNRLVGSKKVDIVKEARKVINAAQPKWKRPARWDTKVSKRIVEVIQEKNFC